MRGSLAGSLWALVLGGAGLGAASELTELPVRDAQTDVAAAVDVPVADGQTTEVPEVIAVPTSPVAEVADEPLLEPVDVAEPTPEAVAPVTDTPQLDTRTAEEQVEPAAPIVPDVPELAAVESEIDVPADTVVVENSSEPEQPAAPQESVVLVPDAAPQIDETPAIVVATPTPEIADQNDTVVDDAIVGTADQSDIAALASPDVPVTVIADAPELQVVDEIEVPLPDVAEIAPQTADPVEEPVEQVVSPQAAQTQEVPADTPDDTPLLAQVDVPAPSPVIIEPQAPAAPTEAAPQVEEVEEETRRVSTVRVNRPGAEPVEPVGQEAEVVPDDDLEVAEGTPAMTRFGAPFENAEGLPLLSFVLVDDGDVADGASALADLGMPVTVVLDASAPDVGARMSAYRAAQIEVGLKTSLPLRATPSDVEVTFAAALSVLPETVMMLSLGDDGVEQNRAVTTQVMEVLAAEGRGLVTVQRGFGNALRAAAQANVPAATILADLSDEGGNDAALARALDQSAFRARQTGSAVMLGKLDAATLAALGAWVLDLDNDEVKLAPVTAILNGLDN